MAMRLRESAEDYLETILILKRRTNFVRSIDIAKEMGYSKPSISRAMSKLRESGYILMEESGEIELTEEGRALAERIYRRHRVLTDFFMALGVPEDVAANEACGIEHHLSDDTFARIQTHYETALKPENDAE